MTGEELDKQMQEMTTKLQKRDANELKKAEKDWRESMGKDTAGHTLNMFRVMQSQIADLQAQIDATNPLAPVLRSLGEQAAALGELMAWRAKTEGGADASEK